MPDDRIMKTVTLNAPVSRVWRALTDARQFEQWFQVELEGQFTQGKAIKARFTGTFDQAAIAQLQRKAGLAPSAIRVPDSSSTFCSVQCIEPERYFSFRWIPYGIDAEIDLQNEPTTLVEFLLEPVASGTQLTITESGFDQVPLHRRERAFLMNEGGWATQAENVKRYVEQG